MVETTNEKYLLPNYNFEMKDSKVKAYYEEEAIAYNQEFYEQNSAYPTLIYRQNYILEMIREIKLPKEAKVLDVGCGPGELLLELIEDFNYMIGLDIADEMVSIANIKKAKLPHSENLTFEVGDIEALRFKSNEFDLIVCSGVIEYLKDDTEWIKEVKRVLKPGGYLIINITNKFSIRKWTSSLVERLKSSRILLKLMNFIKEKVLGKGKIHYFPFKPRLHSPGRFDAYLIKNGFQKINHNYFDFAILPAPLDTILGIITTPIKKRLEKYTRKNMVFNGTGYIVKAKKNSD
jgi:ubiquinone/menaquinone biosynthesis C-methylase UbiE